MGEILFINACVRPESRTKKIAEYLLEKLGGHVTEVDLQKEGILPLNNDRLQERDRAIAAKEASHLLIKYAAQFANADKIVIAAPYWDLSFPASLKAYFEAVTVVGTTFAYSDDGRPYGLCKASELYYVMTAGGPVFTNEFGYGYIDCMCKAFYGIEKTTCIKGEGLDIIGADVNAILDDMKAEIDGLF